MDQPQVLSEEAQHLISLLQNQATVEAEKGNHEGALAAFEMIQVAKDKALGRWHLDTIGARLDCTKSGISFALSLTEQDVLGPIGVTLLGDNFIALAVLKNALLLTDKLPPQPHVLLHGLKNISENVPTGSFAPTSKDEPRTVSFGNFEQPSRQFPTPDQMMASYSSKMEAAAVNSRRLALRASVLNQLGVTAVSLNRYHLATSWFEEALTADPASNATSIASTLINLTSVMMALKRPKPAFAYASKAASLMPLPTSIPQASHSVAGLDKTMTEAELTSHTNQSTMEISVASHHALGQTLAALGKHEKAAETFDAALTLAKSSLPPGSPLISALSAALNAAHCTVERAYKRRQRKPL